MTYIILYFLIGIIFAVISRLHDKEPYPLYLLLAIVIMWPFFILMLIIYFIEHIEI